MGGDIQYLFQDLHGKYFPHLSTLNLPHLENLRKDISILGFYKLDINRYGRMSVFTLGLRKT